MSCCYCYYYYSEYRSSAHPTPWYSGYSAATSSGNLLLGGSPGSGIRMAPGGSTLASIRLASTTAQNKPFSSRWIPEFATAACLTSSPPSLYESPHFGAVEPGPCTAVHSLRPSDPAHRVTVEPGFDSGRSVASAATSPTSFGTCREDTTSNSLEPFWVGRQQSYPQASMGAWLLRSRWWIPHKFNLFQARTWSHLVPNKSNRYLFTLSIASNISKVCPGCYCRTSPAGRGHLVCEHKFECWTAFS